MAGSNEPTYLLTVDGQNITPKVGARLVELRLRESRGEEADQLDITLDDSDGRMAIPPKGAEIALRLGWVHSGLVDKGTFKVDEIEHTGTPDQIHIRARSAELRRGLRARASQSWHATTLGQVVQDIAAKNDLPPRVDPGLAAFPIDHVDQVNESDIHFLTRLARQHDAVATVKKGRLVFLSINSVRTAGGQALQPITITRASGDQHRYHTADRTSYSGVRAAWHDTATAARRYAQAGTEGNVKTLKDVYATEADALAAARAELQRIERGAATLSLNLALGQPALMAQSPVTVQGFKAEIDDTAWLVKSVDHSLNDSGLVTALEMERLGSDVAASEAWQ
jgi:phage protein D